MALYEGVKNFKFILWYWLFSQLCVEGGQGVVRLYSNSLYRQCGDIQDTQIEIHFIPSFNTIYSCIANIDEDEEVLCFLYLH